MKSSQSPAFRARIKRFLVEKRPNHPVTLHEVMKMLVADGFRVRLGNRWLSPSEIDGLSERAILDCNIHDKPGVWERTWKKIWG